MSSRSVYVGVLLAVLVCQAWPGGVGAQNLEPGSIAEAPEALVGTWAGPVVLPDGASLRVAFHISLGDAGGLAATMDVPDQAVTGMAVADVRFEGGALTLELPAIGARYLGTLGQDGAFEGSWTQGGQSFALRLERTQSQAARPSRPQDPSRPVPYREEDVRYPNTAVGITLAGTLTIPDGEGPFPAVVLISGSGPQNRDSEVFGHRPFLVLADHLTRRGIAVLRSDDRGVGVSEGIFAEATTRDFASDTEAAVDWLRAHPDIDPTAVGLVGMSEGGVVAPMVAASSDGVAFIVLMAGPGLPGGDLLYLQGERIAGAEGIPEERIRWNRRLQEAMFSVVGDEDDDDRRAERLEGVIRDAVAELPEAERSAIGQAGDEAFEAWLSGQIQAVSSPWFRFFLRHDPTDVLREVTVPVLALNGSLDLQVPSRENLNAIEAALAEGGNPDVTVRELPGLNHLFQSARTGSPSEYEQIEETMAIEAMEAVAAWIMERS